MGSAQLGRTDEEEGQKALLAGGGPLERNAVGGALYRGSAQKAAAGTGWEAEDVPHARCRSAGREKSESPRALTQRAGGPAWAGTGPAGFEQTGRTGERGLGRGGRVYGLLAGSEISTRFSSGSRT